MLAAAPDATGEVVTIGGERYVVRDDNVLVPAAAYSDPETVTVQEGSVVTYDGQARVVEQINADGGMQLAWRAERTTETQLAPGEEVTLGAESYVVHIADGTRLQLVADRSVYAAQTAQIATFGIVSGLCGVFIVSVLSAVFLAGIALRPSRY